VTDPMFKAMYVVESFNLYMIFIIFQRSLKVSTDQTRELGNRRSRPKVRGGRSDIVTRSYIHIATCGDRTARAAAIKLDLGVAAVYSLRLLSSIFLGSQTSFNRRDEVTLIRRIHRGV